jgi:tetratricopeptide (TPR) repeat protein
MVREHKVRKRLSLILLFLCFLPADIRAEPTSKEARSARLLDTYKKMLREDPSADYPYRRLLEVSHVRGGVSGLITLYLEELKGKASDYALWMVLGHLYRTSDKDPEAQKAYLKASEYAQRKAAPHLALAKLHREQRRWKPSLDAFDKAIALTKGKDAKQQSLKAAAETAMESKDVERAERYFKALVKTAPRNLFLRMEYATTLARSGHKERALALWLDLRRRAKNDLKNLVIVLRELAELQTSLKQYDDAEATWREGLARLSDGHWASSTFLEGLIGIHRRQDRLHELIEAWLPKTRKSYQTLVTVARLYEELANDVESLKLYRTAVKRRPTDANARLQVIKLLERAGRTDEVIEAYRSLIKATRGEARYEIRLAELYFSRGRTKDGMAMLGKLSRGYKSDPGVHQSIIDLLMRYGDRRSTRKIEKEYKLLMRLEPREESHAISLGELYWSKGKRKKALTTWQKLLRIARSKAEGYFLLAEVYVNHNMGAEAVKAFEAAIKLEPRNPRYLQAYAVLLEKNRKFQKALRQWKRVLTQAGRRNAVISREARRRMISLWKRDGRLEIEISRMEETFAQEPVNPGVGGFLGAVYLNLRRRDDAERVFTRVIKAHPKDVDALVGLELVYTRQNKLDAAIKILFRLSAANTRSASEYMHRAADMALSLGKQELALDCMRKVVELNPADPQAHTRVAELHQRMGSLSQAAEAWRQALLLDPRNHRNQFRLAGVYRDTGNAIREEQVLADIIRTAHEPSDVLKAGRQLLRVAAITDRVEALEEVVRPLVFNRRNREIYLRLLVDVYAALARSFAFNFSEADASTKLRELGNRGLKPLLDGVLSSDVTLRNKALEVISLTRPPAVGNALVRLVQSQDRDLQFRAALALGRVGAEGAVRELSKLVRSSNRELRRLAVWSLGNVKSRKAGDALTKLLRVGSNDLRPYVLLALGELGDGPHRSALEDMALKSALNKTRLVAIRSLGRIGSKASYAILLQALTRLPATRGKGRAAKSTSSEACLLAWAIGRTRPVEFDPALIAVLWGPHSQHRRSLARCLRHRSEGSELESMAQSYASFVDEAAMRFAHKQLSFVLEAPRCTPGGKDLLLAQLQQMEEGLSGYFTRQLERGGEAAEVILRSFLGRNEKLSLEPLLTDAMTDSKIRDYLLKLLAHLSPALWPLAEGLDGSTNQELALRLLSLLVVEDALSAAPKKTEGVAIRGLASREVSVRRSAARLLVSLLPSTRSAEVIEAIKPVLNEARGSHGLLLRVEFATLLTAHTSPSVMPLILGLLMDDAATVRHAAVEGLVGNDHREALGHLGFMLNDRVTLVRKAVMRLLSTSPYEEARELLDSAKSPSRAGRLTKPVVGPAATKP